MDDVEMYENTTGAWHNASPEVIVADQVAFG